MYIGLDDTSRKHPKVSTRSESLERLSGQFKDMHKKFEGNIENIVIIE